MGVFSGGMSEPSMGQRQVCKRDYEGEINRLKTQINAASNLLVAVDKYCDCSSGSDNTTFTLNSLIGGLTREIKQLDKHVNSLQEEWENDKR